MAFRRFFSVFCIIFYLPDSGLIARRSCSVQLFWFSCLVSAWQRAQDRERWKRTVETATLQDGACSWWWWCSGPALGTAPPPPARNISDSSVDILRHSYISLVS